MKTVTGLLFYASLLIMSYAAGVLALNMLGHSLSSPMAVGPVELTIYLIMIGFTVLLMTLASILVLGSIYYQAKEMGNFIWSLGRKNG